MSLGTQTTDLLDDLSRVGRWQWLLRLVPVAATAVFLLVLVPAAGGRILVSATVVAVPLCLVTVVLPESAAALGLLTVLVGQWLLGVPEQLGVVTLAAAFDLLVIHVTVALASYAPPGAPLGRVLAVVWARRGAALTGVAVLAWLAARLLAGVGASASGWTMLAGLGVLLVWVGFLHVRLAVAEPE